MSPLEAAYTSGTPPETVEPPPDAPGWVAHPGGDVTVGHAGDGFAFDNEGPRHVARFAAFELCDRLITCGEWLAFIDDRGYRRPELWLSDGWAAVDGHAQSGRR